METETRQAHLHLKVIMAVVGRFQVAADTVAVAAVLAQQEATAQHRMVEPVEMELLHLFQAHL